MGSDILGESLEKDYRYSVSPMTKLTLYWNLNKDQNVRRMWSFLTTSLYNSLKQSLRRELANASFRFTD